jgi:tetratricopeptide (TPR) repeat protein
MIALGVLSMMAATAALAGKPDNITEAEMALLPRYCPDTQTFKYGDASYNTSPNAPKWVGMMGKGFWAMHHYCWALINLGRAQKPWVPPNERQAIRESALGDMHYVIENTDRDFIMLPEIYTKIGEVLLTLNHPTEAGDAFAKARSLKPNYWPPYLQWAEHLRNVGQKAAARGLVEEGLSYSPDAKPLQSLLLALDRDPTTVKPRPPSTVPSVPGQ